MEITILNNYYLKYVCFSAGGDKFPPRTSSEPKTRRVTRKDKAEKAEKAATAPTALTAASAATTATAPTVAEKAEKAEKQQVVNCHLGNI
jgi:hypothetical protein